MMNPPVVAILPIGELDTEPVCLEFADSIELLRRLGGDLIIGASQSEKEGAQQAVEQFAQRSPDLLIIIPLRGSSAPVIEVAARTHPGPCLIWPVQGRFALPSSTLAVGALRESGLPVELVYGPPSAPEIKEAIQCTMKAARAYVGIRRSRIGVIGGLFPNLVSCRYDPEFITARLGATLIPISFEDLHAALQAQGDRGGEIERSRHEIISAYRVDPAHSDTLDAGIKLHLVLKQIAQEQKIDGFATECWSAFPAQFGLNPCLGFIEDDYTLACEGDVMLCLSLLMVRYLAGSSAYVGDLYDLDMNGVLTLIHCGAPASLAASKARVKIEKSPLALERGFETMTCRPHLDPGQVTIFRFYGRDCDKMHIATGELFDCDRSTNLTVRLRLAGNRWDFLKECFGNHYILAAGDIRKALAQICKWLGISIFNT